MNPFVEAGQQPFVRNDSSYDLAFDDLCVVKASGSNTLNGNTPQCKSIASLTHDGVLYPGSKILFGSMPDFTGNISSIGA